MFLTCSKEFSLISCSESFDKRVGQSKRSISSSMFTKRVLSCLWVIVRHHMLWPSIRIHLSVGQPCITCTIPSPFSYFRFPLIQGTGPFDAWHQLPLFSLAPFLSCCGYITSRRQSPTTVMYDAIATTTRFQSCLGGFQC